MIKVLVVDDHPVVRSGLRALLAGEPTLTVVGTAASGEAALTLVADLTPRRRPVRPTPRRRD